MLFKIEASCGCNIGKLRTNNEDNFFFNGKHLPLKNNGLESVQTYRGWQWRRRFFCVFDGMGGEKFGEVASYTAAKAMKRGVPFPADIFIPAEKYLRWLTDRLSEAVIGAQSKVGTNRMGSTSVMLYFTSKNAYVCNVGDSRAYLLREGELQQISVDHVSSRPRAEGGKAPLTQYLGLDSPEVRIDPYIAKHPIERGDVYLICSDGVSDMLTEAEIVGIMQNSDTAEHCADRLVEGALSNGGRDNITAIVCKII